MFKEERKINPKLPIGFGLGILVVSMLILPSCSRTSGAQETKPAQTPVVSVGVVKVTREDLSRTLTLAAEFRPYQEIEVHAKVSGYVKKINVDVGDKVKEGQLLAILEIPEFKNDLEVAAADKNRYEQEINRAKSEIVRAQAAHDDAHVSYERLSSVVKAKPNLIAQQEIDDAAGRDRITEAQLETTKAALAVAEQQLAASTASERRVKTVNTYSQITAPFSGVITKRFADTGALIQAGTSSNTQAMPLVRLSENGRLRLILPVPESIVPKIRFGQSVDIKIQASGQTLVGTVSRFSSKVDPATRTMEVEVDVPNPDLKLTPGMYASATLTLDKQSNAIAVTTQAVANQDTKPTVLVVGSDKHIEERAVTLGLETEAKVEVLSGLNEGDMVIIGNRSQYKAGQLVEPKPIGLSKPEGGR